MCSPKVSPRSSQTSNSLLTSFSLLTPSTLVTNSLDHPYHKCHLPHFAMSNHQNLHPLNFKVIEKLST